MSIHNENTMSDTLRVGDTIRVLDLNTDRIHRAKVAALWPKDRTISVDVQRMGRHYLKAGRLGTWFLPDMVGSSVQMDAINLPKQLELINARKP